MLAAAASDVLRPASLPSGLKGGVGGGATEEKGGVGGGTTAEEGGVGEGTTAGEGGVRGGAEGGVRGEGEVRGGATLEDDVAEVGGVSVCPLGTEDIPFFSLGGLGGRSLGGVDDDMLAMRLE